MKKAMIDYMKKEINDELYTPMKALDYLYPVIRVFKTFTHKEYSRNPVAWEPSDHGDSNITSFLKKIGYRVISTHIKDGYDFFNYEPEEDYDLIITNPPYSLKTEWLKRSYEIGKPFYYLLPLTTLEGKERGKLFKEHGIHVFVIPERINFMKNKNNVWFNTSWFAWKIPFNEQKTGLYFLSKEETK